MSTKVNSQLEIRQLLHDWQSGNTHSRDQLFEKLYVELKKLSSTILRGENHISISAGDLVNEAAIRLMGLNNITWQDKAHFMALASRMMRRVLIDHARRKNTNKRGHKKVTLITNHVGLNQEQIDIQHIEEALVRLQILDKERADIVEMRYYGGLSIKEITEVTGKSVSTIKRNWRVSRAWLAKTISESRSAD